MRLRLLVLVLFFCAEALAGEAVSVKARVWPQSITIGGETKVFLQIERPKDVTLRLPAESLKVEPFEIKSVASLPSAERGASIRESIQLTVTAFETGDLTFPPLAIAYETASGAGGTVWTKPLQVKIQPVTKPTDKKMKPIKGVVSFGVLVLKTAVLGSLAFLLLVFLFVKVGRRGVKKIKIDPETLKPPHERALLELGRLEKKDHVAAGFKKDFYGELSQVLKRYLGRRYGFDAMDLTTSEILTETKGGPMDELARRQMKEALDEADLVKFANLSPSESEAARSAERVRDIVRLTAPDESEEKAEAAK